MQISLKSSFLHQAELLRAYFERLRHSPTPICFMIRSSGAQARYDRLGTVSIGLHCSSAIGSADIFAFYRVAQTLELIDQPFQIFIADGFLAHLTRLMRWWGCIR